MTEITLADWRVNACKTPVGALHFHIALWDFDPPSYSYWVGLVEDAIMHQVDLMASKRNHFHDLDEDALSSVVVQSLENLNLECSAKAVNGNVDIAIEYRGYQWLGEAKIASDVQKVFHGYQQLTTRYCPGVQHSSAGGMLLYCLHDKANVTMAGWRAALNHQMPDSQVRDGPNALTFRSTDCNNSVGSEFGILHIAFPLHHDPQEEKLKLSPAAIRAARDARKVERGATVC